MRRAKRRAEFDEASMNSQQKECGTRRTSVDQAHIDNVTMRRLHEYSAPSHRASQRPIVGDPKNGTSVTLLQQTTRTNRFTSNYEKKAHRPRFNRRNPILLHATNGDLEPLAERVAGVVPPWNWERRGTGDETKCHRDLP
jgi:hypothetical protein